MKQLHGKVLAVMAAGIASCVAARPMHAQSRPFPGPDLQKTYERLLTQIEKIAAYDNHAHPGFGDDSDVDAMAAPPDESSTLRVRDDNPEFVVAAKALFNYPYDDFKPEHAKWLADKSKAAEQAGDKQYFNSILDKLNIETCLANRAMMPGYLDSRRFHWVFFVDSFFYPFDNTSQTASTPDMGVYVPLQEKMLGRYKKLESVSGIAGGFGGLRRFCATHAGGQPKIARGRGHQI